MVQDIHPKKFYNEYGYHSIKEEGTGTISHVPAEEDYVLLFQGRTVYLREKEGEVHLPRYDECKKAAETSDNAEAQMALQQTIFQSPANFAVPALRQVTSTLSQKMNMNHN